MFASESAIYHVQTEDRGPSHPFLDTVVYMAGRVVYKRSTSYEQFASGLEAETLAQKLHERLAQQHREVIAELEAGTLPIQSKAESASGLPEGAERRATKSRSAPHESEDLVRRGKCDSRNRIA